MALTYTAYAIEVVDTLQPSVTTTSRSYTAGDLVLVLWSAWDHSAGTHTIANSGTAQTWTRHADVNVALNCNTVAWSCVMSTTQSMTITVTSGNANLRMGLCVITHNGQHATTPIPAGKVFSGSGGTDVSQSITPTSSGSCLWMIAADYNNTNTFAAAANCSLDPTVYAGLWTMAIIRPTTQPRTDAASFTIGETDTSGKIAWIALEVQSAGGITPTYEKGTLSNFLIQPMLRGPY